MILHPLGVGLATGLNYGEHSVRFWGLEVGVVKCLLMVKVTTLGSYWSVTNMTSCLHFILCRTTA